MTSFIRVFFFGLVFLFPTLVFIHYSSISYMYKIIGQFNDMLIPLLSNSILASSDNFRLLIINYITVRVGKKVGFFKKARGYQVFLGFFKFYCFIYQLFKFFLSGPNLRRKGRYFFICNSPEKIKILLYFYIFSINYELSYLIILHNLC